MQDLLCIEDVLLCQSSSHLVPLSTNLTVSLPLCVSVQKPRSETMRGSLRLLTTSASRLQNECRKAVPSDGCSGPDMQLVTQQVIQCAYDIAKAAKQLVTITTKENTNQTAVNMLQSHHLSIVTFSVFFFFILL